MLVDTMFNQGLIAIFGAHMEYKRSEGGLKIALLGEFSIVGYIRPNHYHFH